ncbi:unnamed protein product [Clonostachys rosea f. rosea IK726]|uniref:Uncharacterized protein n=2 Tax=Bionectria ochroleuca TaxID=29856 RepID=A0A0B7KQD9_BIOOC|nr:unnamed protein product [Clonostachys rosea f. rosea IK726]
MPVFQSLSYCWSTSTQIININIQPPNSSYGSDTSRCTLKAAAAQEAVHNLDRLRMHQPKRFRKRGHNKLA